MANRVDDVTLNFTLNARAVEQAGQALRKEMETGLGAVDFNYLRRNADRTFKQLGGDLQKALNQKVTLDTGHLDRQLAQIHDKRLQMERSLANESQKGIEQGGRKQEVFAKLRERLFKRFAKMEERLLKAKTDGMKRLNKLAQKHVGILKKGGKGGGGGNLMKSVGGGKGGGGKMAGNLMGNMGKMGKMVGMLGKLAPALGGVMAALGPVGAAIGALVAGLGGLAVVVGAVVGVFAGLATIAIAADGAAKGMNKEILRSVSGADLLTQGIGSATKNLDVFRRSAIDASSRLGSLAKDNIAILGSLNEHGLTIREMGRDMGNAALAGQAYTKALEHVLTYSRMIGESATTVAQQMATAGEELGLTLSGVAAQFSKITKFAMESGFSTKRFYSMVIQATSGMSMYNVRLSEAAGMLVRIGKILGQKTGGEFLSSLSKGFVNESMQDRIKRVMLTGKGRTKDTFERSADNTTADFQEKLEKATKGLTGADGAPVKIDLSELSGGKMTGDMVRMSRDGLREELAKLDPAEQAKFLARFAAKMESVSAGEADGLRQSLSTLIEVNEGAKGGTLNMAKQLGSLDMGGKLNMLKDSMKTMFPGKEIHELSTLQLAALENATGMQGEQLHQMRKLTQGLEGNFNVLQEDAKAGKVLTEEQKKEQIKAYGAFVENGKVISATIDKNGKIDRTMFRNADGELQPVEIKNFDQYIQSQGKRLGAMEEAKNFNEDRAISADIAKNTFSIKDMIASGITMVLERIYGAVKGILGWLFREDPEKQNAIAVQAANYEKADVAVTQMQELDGRIRDQERELQKTGDLGEKEAIRENIRLLTDMRKQASMDADIFKALGDGVFNQDGTVNAEFSKQADKAGAGWDSTLDTALSALPGVSGGTNRNLAMDEVPAAMRASFTSGAANYDVLQSLMDANPEIKASLTKKHGEMMEKYRSHNAGSSLMTPDETSAMLSQKKDHLHNADWITHNTNVRNIDNTRLDDRVTHTGGSDFTASTGIYSNSGDEVSMHGLQDAFAHNRKDHGTSHAVIRARGVDQDIGGRGDRGHSGTAATRPLTGASGVVSDAIRRYGVVDMQRELVGAQESTAPIDTDLDISEDNFVYANRASVTNPSIANQHQLGGIDNYNAVASRLHGQGMDMLQSVPTITQYNDTGQGSDMGGYQSEPSQATGDAFKSTTFDSSGNLLANPADAAAITTGGTFSAGTGDAVAFFDSLIKSGAFAPGEGTEANMKAVEKTLEEVKEEAGAGFTLKAWQDYLSRAYPQEVDAYKQQLKTQQGAEKHLGELKKLMEKQPDTMTKALQDAHKQETQSNLLGMVGLEGNNAAARQMEDGTVSRDSQLGRKLIALTEGENVDETTKAVIRDAMGRAGVRLQDFIYTGGANGGVISPIHGQDSFIGMRPRGPVDNVMSRGGGGGTINVNVYSDVDIEKVKRAVYTAGRQLGIGGRGKTRAGNGNFGGNVA